MMTIQVSACMILIIIINYNLFYQYFILIIIKILSMFKNLNDTIPQDYFRLPLQLQIITLQIFFEKPD